MALVTPMAGGMALRRTHRRWWRGDSLPVPGAGPSAPVTPEAGSTPVDRASRRASSHRLPHPLALSRRVPCRGSHRPVLRPFPWFRRSRWCPRVRWFRRFRVVAPVALDGRSRPGAGGSAGSPMAGRVRAAPDGSWWKTDYERRAGPGRPAGRDTGSMTSGGAGITTSRIQLSHSNL